MSLAASAVKLSQINTNNEYVDFILDLLSYTPEQLSDDISILDAGCGNGNFILNAIDRYLTLASRLNLEVDVISENISNLFVGFEFDESLCNITKLKIKTLLSSKWYLPEYLANNCAENMIIQGDFLKWDTNRRFHVIVENPPYIRYDNLPKTYIKWLRNNFTSFTGRSDLCVPFIQKSLSLLSDVGKLAVLSTNRFTVCNYGKNLRELIMNEYGISKIVDCTDTQPFDKKVTTYPWIFIFDKIKRNSFKFIKIDKDNRFLTSINFDWNKIYINDFSQNHWRILKGDELLFWKSIKNKNTHVLGDFNSVFDVKIGLATGADKVYINPPIEANIEEELLTPLILSKRLKDNVFNFKTDLLLNTWCKSNSKSLINLDDWPNAAQYLKRFQKKLKSRYVAKKDITKWYRLIDRLNLAVLKKEKLIFPSFRKALDIYYDDGKAFPHHNCYYIIKKGFDGPSLTALGAIFSSKIMKKLTNLLFIRFNGNAGRLMKSHFLEIPMPNQIKILDYEKDLEKAFFSCKEDNLNSLVDELYNPE